MLFRSSEHAGTRIDQLKLKGAVNVSRARFQALIRSGSVKVNGFPTKPSYILKENDHVEYTIPEPVKLEIIPQKLPVFILYEDHDIVVVDKPRGMVVHPGAGINKDTVVNALLYHCHDLSGIGGVTRPGIVHRLDKGTSGVMIVAKNDRSHLALSRQFSTRTMDKRYLALVKGVPNWKEKSVVAPIGRHPTHRVKMAVIASGKTAETVFKLLARGHDGSLVAAKPTSGRTHQIRVHLDYLGFPVIGDPLYGKGKQGKVTVSLKSLLRQIDGFCLHAESLLFQHPTTGKPMKIQAPIPDDFYQVMDELHLNYLDNQ